MMPDKTSCAYCGGPGPMTKEHIFPKFLYRQFPTQKLGYNERADRFMSWEAQVRDVCEGCNNGALSKLDQYAREFLTAMRCERTYQNAEQLEFDYDYSLLLRWLLKVSYNAARALSTVPSLLQAAVPFIRDGEAARPEIAFLSVEVVRDTPIPDAIRQDLPPDARDWRYIPARMFRVGPGILHDPRGGVPQVEYSIRFVAINAWYFTVCLVEPGTDRASRRRIATSYRSFVPDSVPLRSLDTRARINVSRRTGTAIYAPQGLRVADQWRDYANRVLRGDVM